VEVERTALPGIGLRHVFTTSRRRRLGVVSHRSGRRDLVVDDRAAPDTAAQTVTLTREEANAQCCVGDQQARLAGAQLASDDGPSELGERRCEPERG
jgi:K+/H+ antiporter YhaU regulatory subunit KhtT